MVNSHNIAMDDGLEPDSDEYFEFIEQRLGYRKRDDLQNLQSMSSASTATQRRSAPPAAPSSRSANSGTSSGNVVRLTAEQKEMAQMMGLKPEEYAKNMLDLKKEGKL
jgi:phage I-like protein